MRLDKLVLKNFCQHKELSWEFPSGIIAISGPNGSGKSNAIKAAYAALTGDFKRNEGVQADNINKTCSDKDESFVELTFSVNGNVSTINRSLRPNRRSLIINGGTPITSEKEVTSAVEGLIGVSSDILNDYIFVDQWRMFEVFTAPKSSRLVALQSLYGLGKAEVCYDEISKAVTKIRIPDPTESLEDIELHLREKNLLLDSINSSLSSIKAQDLDYSDLEAQLEVIKQIKWAVDTINDSNKKLADNEKIINELKVELSKNDVSKVLGSFKDIFELNSYVDRLNIISDAWTAAAIKEKQINILTCEINDTRSKIDSLGECPVKPENYVPVSEFSRINETVGSVLHAKKSLESLKNNNECPTCKSSGSNLKEAIKTLEENLFKLEPLADSLSKSYSSSREYDSSFEAYNSSLRELKSKLDVQEPILDNLITNKGPNPEMSKEEALSEIESLNQIKKKYKDVSEEVERIVNRIAAYEGFQKALVSNIDQANKTIKELGSANKDFDYVGLESELIKAIDVVKANKENKIRLEEKLISTVDSINFLEKRKSKLISDKNEAKINSVIKEHMEKLREVMHKSNLPKKVTVSYLKQTVIKMNNYLEDFNAPFRVYSDDELVFWAKFSDGRDLPAARLSGGEKVVLALAFRLAVQFGVAANVNLLVLDEPTVGLDDDNIECLETAFNRLRSMSKSSGLQVLVVSHEKAIERMCDHTLSLYR